MLRQAPSLEAAEAFLAAARARSFRAAAAELALSPSAFSRRIQMLEAFVEAPLFDRSGPAVRLTEVGARYLSQIEPAMETIRRATADLKDAAGRLGRLRLATSHSLAVGWLIPRLPDLLQRHGLEVDLTVGRGPQVLRSGAADIALWGGDGGEDDLACDRIVDLDGVLVSAPTLADGRAPPRRLEDLAAHRMLSVRSPPDLWSHWLSGTGCGMAAASTPFDTSHLMYEAAASGLGVTLAVPLLAERFLAERRLRPCLGVRRPVGSGYSLFYASADLRRRPQIRTFLAWLQEQAAGSLRTFDAWWDAYQRDAAAEPSAAAA
ncbi:hypothetical protein C5708_17305 [Caulobacter sp. CCUG 60055]|uniref:LysR substrate-binding domain-containing protein n=1 Tax=Caulobacter sp. CCUG 60055 TaxID=2100090 RepID=UPI001FA749F3|nr:LysR substrate-binding domain-containing protein [Caulobacter sp. CCUG 60055]MBQ1541377.1 LysR family transcriptional regulator [Caulobacteraceae bacterium]MCI3182005.1 hypothetical protein [Caulobacter sp. CCUG 60055]